MSQARYSFDQPFIGAQGLIIPSSLAWLARRLFKKLKDRGHHPDVDYAKAEGLLESFLKRETKDFKTGQQPTHALCPGIQAKPFWQNHDAPLIDQLSSDLKARLGVCQQEYQAASAKKEGSLTQSINTGEQFLEKDLWLNYKLGQLGNYSDEAKELFPQTIAMLEKYQSRIFSAEFIVMESDTTLPPHTDATNAYLVAHLGLDVPANCGVQVDKHIVDFAEGDVIFFDQSYVHSAWNKGDRTRTNLLITFFHPDISDKEISLLLLFLNKLQKQALVLSPFIFIEYSVRYLFQKLKA